MCGGFGTHFKLSEGFGTHIYSVDDSFGSAKAVQRGPRHDTAWI